MRLTRTFLPLALAGLAASCGSIPNETAPTPDGIEVAPVGVLRGTVVYNGPHPCSKDGHIVGAAVLLVFDRRLLPPPSGLGSTPLNFAVVVGDALFANEPRNPGPTMYCPKDHGVTDMITVTAPFAISPVPAGSFVLQSFYDYTGNFLPSFKFRNLPEQGDIGGGDIDTSDALNNTGNPNYLPHFTAIDIGTPEPLVIVDGGPPGAIPNFTLPPTGFVADNLTVTVGAVFQTTRPYFYPGGMATSFDPSSGALVQIEAQHSDLPPTSLVNIGSTQEKHLNFDPVLTIPQDIEVLAAPQAMTGSDINNFESKFPRLILHPGLPGKIEPPKAIVAPFNLQLPPSGTASSFPVWQNALFNPTSKKWEAQDVAGQPIPQLWPLVILTKLIDNPGHTLDPSSIKTQGSPTAPVVVIQGVTLLGGDGERPDEAGLHLRYGPGGGVWRSVRSGVGTATHLPAGPPDRVLATRRHLLQRALRLRRTRTSEGRSSRRTSWRGRPTSRTRGRGRTGLAARRASSPQVAALVNGHPVAACLPTGRYSINLVYPDGQAWTVPNESGACSDDEGATNYKKLTCPIKPRPILHSQGARAVVEITPAANDPAHHAGGLPAGDPSPHARPQ